MLIPLLRRYLAPYRGAIAVVLVFQLAQTVANLYLPGLNADIIDRGIVTGDVPFIWRTGATMLLVTVLQVGATVVAVYVGARVAMALGRDLRAAVFDRVETFAAREMAQLGAPTLITRSTNDVQQVQMLAFMGLTLLVTAPIMAVGGVVMALRQDVELSALLLVALPALLISVGLIIRRMRPLFRQMQDRVDGLNGVMREQIQGIRVIRAFVKEKHETQRFDDANQAYLDVAVATGRLMSLMFPTVMLIMNVSVVLATWFGGYRIASGDLQVGTLTAFQNYLIQILMAVMMATFMLMLWPRAEVSAERITEVLETEPSIVVDPDATPAHVVRGEVELRGASYAYPGAEVDVLHDVDLVARPGETTAIIGSTGSGKTTLMSLVPRLFDVTGGAVLLDGHDVRDLEPQAVWAAIGLVPQRAFLFSGTVASNLRYGRDDATDEELWQALEVAQAREFVEAMPGGLQAPVTQGGTNVSGGQRQRLAIARAVVKRPLVYLFDDSFSALDYATDAALRRALRAITRESAVITVAQRVSTIRDADRIVVLDQGTVVSTGTHAELMADCDVYREIVLSQLTEEEAA
ncbi:MULTISPECIES: ABC transporter ATP-binding protein [unclassified Aeromicrobium]|uniref:ABC transporter ATP-binding protein n=1 Tax=unclassified Aeromicrobium TaxID=2633570 RepID=UPI0006F2E23F|nr:MULTISPECIES: ABC transporter ATP-binding protein [unclassified Aeromicrobium]KQO38789.1 multidrug ABC transporter ATP-binding protein [Aeromicrobium sp. Leaf245]KQP82039.1 multidrug ABC transporter ATP-binding protein [Aeromicrobium sp. Leaf291]